MTNYSFQKEQSEKTVKVLGKYLPISHKTSFEVAAAIRGKKVNAAITFLENVAARKEAVAFKRYLKDTPHRRGPMAAGRYPKKASLEISKLLHSIKKNAEDKNLNAEDLKIIHAAAQKGPNIMHPGRTRGKRKITHFEIVVEEASEAKVPKKVEKAVEKPAEKPVKEEKKVEKKETKPKAASKKATAKKVEKKVEKPKAVKKETKKVVKNEEKGKK